MSSDKASLHSIIADKIQAKGPITYAEFSEACLYHPEYGYYCTDRNRVGRSRETDFYTSSSIGSLFGKLIADAVSSMIDPRLPSDLHFVEIGAEKGRCILDEVDHTFKSVTAIPYGESFDIPDNSVVFSNELFDAQPFHRLIRKRTGWRELSIGLAADGHLIEIEGDLSAPIEEKLGPLLPSNVHDDYRLDISLKAEELLANIIAQPWKGIFMAFDYGKTWSELAEFTPNGTARAYHRHQQSNNLLDRLGEQDLTTHVCWDRLENILQQGGFTRIETMRQETFFMVHAKNLIGQIIQNETSGIGEEKRALSQLLHPTHMGHKFQVLIGNRK